MPCLLFSCRLYLIIIDMLLFGSQPGKYHLEKHYAALSDKPFFSSLVEYMDSGPIMAMVS